MDLEANIRNIVEKAIAGHVFPGAVVGYIYGNKSCIMPFGHLTYDANSPTVVHDTVYDLASVTKSVVTGCVILALAEKGFLSLNDQACTYLPEMANPQRVTILIKHLLSFTVAFDLPHGLSSYAAGGPAAILNALYHAPLKYPSGQSYAYSNAPMLLLGRIAEQVMHKSLDAIADELFFAPLRMTRTTFHPQLLPSAIIAPTEIVDGQELVGIVHDESARALYKAGIAPGHAGLFSTAPDLLRFGHMLLGDGSYGGRHYFNHDSIQKMLTEVIRNDTHGGAMGWSTFLRGFMEFRPSPTVFCKDGFTGTLFMADPPRKLCLVMLSNSTYPKRYDSVKPLNEVRRQLVAAMYNQ